MSLVKIAFEYRTLTPTERKAYIAHAKKNEEKNKKIAGRVVGGFYGLLGGALGGALAHEASKGSAAMTGLGALAGGTALGVGGYHLAKADMERTHDAHFGRMHRPEKKWLITKKNHAEVMKGAK